MAERPQQTDQGQDGYGELKDRVVHINRVTKVVKGGTLGGQSRKPALSLEASTAFSMPNEALRRPLGTLIQLSLSSKAASSAATLAAASDGACSWPQQPSKMFCIF